MVDMVLILMDDTMAANDYQACLQVESCGVTAEGDLMHFLHLYYK